jgi:uncharacterized protein (TIGR02391 family)
MTNRISAFPLGTVEGVSKIIGDLYSGTELTRITSEVPLRSDPGEGHTKWRRLAHAVSSNQAKTGNGNALIALVRAAMRPERTLDRKPRADVARDELNQVLSLVSLKVLPDGRVARAKKASTDTEALARSERLYKILEQRGAHAEVLVYCREDLVRRDYYEAVFEAIKGLGARIRSQTGVDADGYSLIDKTMCGSSPPLRVNDGQTRTERDEQLGISNLSKGLFSAFRNPVVHEPKLHWTMSELDALDVLGTLSMIHRRLDAATSRNGEGT